MRSADTGVLDTPLIITRNVDGLGGSHLVKDHAVTPTDLASNAATKVALTLVERELLVVEVLTASHLVDEAVQAWVDLE